MGQSTSSQQDTNSNRKKFIVLYGPTGSGKGSVYKQYLKSKLLCTDVDKKCLEKNKYFMGEVDKYVENDTDYQKLIKELDDETDDLMRISNKIQKVNSEIKNDETDGKSVTNTIKKSIKIRDQIYELEKMLNKLKQKSLAEKMTKIYFDIRNSKKYNIRNEVDIVDHMYKGYNIIFEITGTNSQTIQKICDDNLFSLSLSNMTEDNRKKYSNISIQKDYEVVVLVPFTTYKKLPSRIIGRFMKAKTSGENVRLVPTDEKKLSSDEKQAFDNLVTLIMNKCVDKVIVYDNNDDNNHIAIESIEINPRNSDKPECNLSNKLRARVKSKSFSDFIINIC